MVVVVTPDESGHVLCTHDARVARDERLEHVRLARVEGDDCDLTATRLVRTDPQVLHPDVRVGVGGEHHRDGALNLSRSNRKI